MGSDVVTKIEDFFSQYRLRTYVKGQILLLNGDKAESVYFIVEGNVKQYDVTYRGDEIILNIFKPQAFFPMSLAINKGANPYIYEAETDVSLRQAPAADVVSFVKDNPDVLFDLLSRVYKGVDGLLTRMSYLMASSARNRLIYELITEARRFGKIKNNTCHLSVSEKDLGARAGLSRETVSREVTKLKTEGLIGYSTKGLEIMNIAMLEEIIEGQT